MGRAIIVRVLLPEIGFALYELWEIDGRGKPVARRRISPARLVDGVPDPREIDRAKQFLRDVAREAKLEVVREDD